jgi:tetratricopeptide (TPR) repeat protein
MTSRLLGLTARQPAISAAMMKCSTVYAAVLGGFLAGPALYMSVEQLRQNSAAPQIGLDAPGKNTTAVEDWPICTSAGLGRENADWAQLDPDFAAGKKAMIAKDWDAAISALASAALRDPRNADIQAYLGVSYRNLRQFGPAFRHYQQALSLNPRHRGAVTLRLR